MTDMLLPKSNAQESTPTNPLPRSPKKVDPQWIAYLEGWRLIAILKTGRKWIRIIELGTGDTRRMSLPSWRELDKRPVVRLHGFGWKALWNHKGPHDETKWDNAHQGKVVTKAQFESLIECEEVQPKRRKRSAGT